MWHDDGVAVRHGSRQSRHSIFPAYVRVVFNVTARIHSIRVWACRCRSPISNLFSNFHARYVAEIDFVHSRVRSGMCVCVRVSLRQFACPRAHTYVRSLCSKNWNWSISGFNFVLYKYARVRVWCGWIGVCVLVGCVGRILRICIPSRTHTHSRRRENSVREQEWEECTSYAKGINTPSRRKQLPSYTRICTISWAINRKEKELHQNELVYRQRRRSQDITSFIYA